MSVAARDPAGPRNVLSFDLEHWHSATLLRDEVRDPVDRIERSVEIVLALLDGHDVSATFFVVGAVAERRPDLIRSVADRGHEIASHGHTHSPLYELDREGFRHELDRSTDAIRTATGDAPVGFRAPNFSVSRETGWAFDVLRDAGYEYDASVFPAWTPMYGVRDAPRTPYAVSRKRPFAPGGSGSLIELPAAVLSPGFGVRIPVAGGFYGRLLPTAALERGIRRLNRRGAPATLYFHPWEFNPDVPVRDVPPHKRFVSFHGIDRLEAKLDRLLSRFEFGTARDAVREATERGRHREPAARTTGVTPTR